ncbi:cell division protein ZapE [Rhodococcus sp. HNM0569]|uniref:cell division protein ZapE n=1 Tax=Rhodococcus sp. HNM0569 TaxID=2716340 RepID=UPI00146B2B28|nr:cell division protein ZapE [Rhodococcus sp. HNM0569]NLU83474.1 cell division protein ZapE [Rhodococcus sp. HNM0569]
MLESAATDAGFVLDAAQRRAVDALSAVDAGVYAWGPPGRGKSWLMAAYFAALPTERKLRVHFHAFFRDLHAAIRECGNDIEAALDSLVGDADVVCFDEFHVHDPADAKFIARLMPVLYARSARVILTSNYPPRSLLPNPLFHADFVPTIELIERMSAVVAVDGPVDYRTRSRHEDGFAAGWWVAPGTAEQLAALSLVRPPQNRCETLFPAGHPVRIRGAEGRRLWVDFADLCGGTTAPVDYLALAEGFSSWVIDGIPDLRSAGREPAQRFANVVDVLCDRGVTPVLVAATTLARATAGGAIPIDAARIVSRLGQLREVGTETPFL